jgi:hypothetical protein
MTALQNKTSTSRINTEAAMQKQDAKMRALQITVDTRHTDNMGRLGRYSNQLDQLLEMLGAQQTTMNPPLSVVNGGIHGGLQIMRGSNPHFTQHVAPSTAEKRKTPSTTSTEQDISSPDRNKQRQENSRHNVPGIINFHPYHHMPIDHTGMSQNHQANSAIEITSTNETDDLDISMENNTKATPMGSNHQQLVTIYDILIDSTEEEYDDLSGADPSTSGQGIGDVGPDASFGTQDYKSDKTALSKKKKE